MNYRAFGLASLLVAVGCGGGGGSAPTSAPPVQATQTPTQAYKNTAMLTLSFPVGKQSSSKAKRPDYISPNSAFLDVLINSVDGGAVPSWAPADSLIPLSTTGGSPNCSVAGGTETCAVPIAAPPGSVAYSFSVLDNTHNPLATVSATKAITQGVITSISVTLQGIVNNVTASVTPALAANTSGTTPVILTPTDASGATIVDGTTAAPYALPYTLNVLQDAGAQTSLNVTSSYHAAQSGQTVSVYSPSDVVTVSYTGRAINGFQIRGATNTFTALDSNMNTLGTNSINNAVATTVSDIILTGTTADTTSPSDVNYNQQTLFFSQPSGSAGVSASEFGWTNAPYNLKYNLVFNPSSCTGVASSSTANPATTFIITAAGVGICEVQFVEDPAQPGTPLNGHPTPMLGVGPTKNGIFWVSVTNASITGN
jgi:hypothetical protein